MSVKAPCPFCGGTAYDIDTEDGGAALRCDDCGRQWEIGSDPMGCSESQIDRFAVDSENRVLPH
jgi:hypothetical protein